MHEGGPRLELRHLEYFVALAEELHFGRAADRLFIVQPTLSKQVAALEKELGTDLFVRTKRHVALTAAGEAFLSDARQVLAQADGAKARARLASRGDVGVLEIGFVVPVLYDLLPHMLRAFRASYPEVRLSLHELHDAEIVTGLLSRDLHLGFARLPAVGGRRLRTRPLVDEPVMVAVPAGHTLASQHSVALTDLACEDLMGGLAAEDLQTNSLQGGAGTSLNMNVNECVANRAIERLGGQKGDYDLIHPLNDVNRSQ